MTAPIYGPIWQSETSGYTWAEKSWYRQKPPYNLNLPYLRRFGFAATGLTPLNYAWTTSVLAEASAGDAALYAQAYSKLVGKLGENAGVGITLTQWRQADSMIRNRANTLSAFTGAVFRRSPIGIARSLGISVKKAQAALHPKYRGAKGLSNLWLEFWFGWKPMVQDIYTACEVFDNFIPWDTLTGSASRPLQLSYSSGEFSSAYRFAGKAACKVGIDVRLVNPNVRLLQQFGLLNPASVAWDAVPWSFVIDWFANVNQWLSSFTDFAGFETSNGYVTKFAAIQGNFKWPAYPGYGGPAVGVFMSRALSQSLPRPALQLKGWSMKPTRALTAITLLTQKLPSR